MLVFMVFLRFDSPEAVTIREFKWQLKDLLPARRVSTVELILGLNKLTDESKTVEEAGISDGSEARMRQTTKKTDSNRQLGSAGGERVKEILRFSALAVGCS